MTNNDRNGNMAAKISIRSVGKVFEQQGKPFEAVRDISLEIGQEEFLCIVGPSGCGKSTLLRILGDLEEASSGAVEIAHEDRQRPLTAMIFQQESVFPWLTVEQNAAYGLKVTNSWNGAESRERVEYFLERTGLLQFRKFRPHQLSGGMKQRLSVARAFITNPEVLLMDEPFAALDEQNKMLLQQELEKLWEEFRSTVVFITHSLDEAVLLGDRVVVMTSVPGRIKEAIEVPFARPRDLIELRRTPEFGEITHRLWEALREEVQRARTLEVGKVAGRGNAATAEAAE
jgi:NitT/TauT family transport system ATP-binding protein